MAEVDVLTEAVHLVTEARASGRFLSDLFEARFRRLGVPEPLRGPIVRLVTGTFRTERLLDRVSAARGEAPTEWSRVALRARLDAGDRDATAALATVEAELLRAPLVERVAVLGSLPDDFAARLVRDFGEAALELARALAAPPPQTVRANRLVNDRDALARRLLDEGVATTPTRLAQDGLTIVTPVNLFRTAAFREGRFEVQDEGSQLVSELVSPPPRSAVLDLCAGAGGKSLHLAALLEGRGKVFVHDVAPAKLDALTRRARRAGCSNVERLGDRARLAPVARALVDAPCSGLGVLRRNPETRLSLAPDRLARFPDLQLALLQEALPMVAPRGRLIYATCTLRREENDDVVARLLELHPELERVPAKEILGRARAEALGDGEVLRVLPHTHGTDGFFAVVLRRRAST